MKSAAEGDWTEAIRHNNFRRAWEISDRDLREYCASGAIKHVGERHLQRIWRGEDLSGKRVLVRCYHGLGDTIQFVRFVEPLRRIAREVILWVQPELVEVLRDVAGIDQLFALHTGAPDFSYDVDIEIMELAHALRATAEMISNRVPYIPRSLSARRACGSPIGIGLVWEAGNWDRRRCVPPHLLSRLFIQPDVHLFSLQHGSAREMAAAIPADDIGTSDLVALAKTIVSLDLIITVDTMVAHLAGALGAPVWTLLHADCDWRWSKTDHHSIWYPSMRLFHQQKQGDWSEVVDEIAGELKRRSPSGNLPAASCAPIGAE